MDIITRYQQALTTLALQPDPSQAHAVQILHRCFMEHQKVKQIWHRLFPRINSIHEGVYLWGDVGRGKTMLMDLFYKSLNTSKKQRWHFQAFIQYVHQQLHRLQGEKNPLTLVVDTFVRETEILCLDEFLVEDIADALLLTGLIPALLKKKVLLVITGNLAPDHLYQNGWQRELFLPTIEYLKKHLYIVPINLPHDYRRQIALSENFETHYIYPDDARAEIFLENKFNQLAKPPYTYDTVIDVNQRSFKTIQCSNEIFWCTFQECCVNAHSGSDYLALCDRFHTILISHVPLLDEHYENAARRFITLVDICYDRRRRLILSAAVPITELYCGKLLQHAFQRTLSRLWEMQKVPP